MSTKVGYEIIEVSAGISELFWMKIISSGKPNEKALKRVMEEGVQIKSGSNDFYYGLRFSSPEIEREKFILAGLKT